MMIKHGTAIITLSALLNALTLSEKKLEDILVVILGAGSAGYGIYKIRACSGMYGYGCSR